MLTRYGYYLPLPPSFRCVLMPELCQTISIYFNGNIFQRHDKSLNIFCCRPTFCFRFRSFWFIIICHWGPKARQAWNTPPSWEYLFSSWRDWYSTHIHTYIYTWGAYALTGLARFLRKFSTLSDRMFYHKGKQFFLIFFSLLRRCLPVLCTKMI